MIIYFYCLLLLLYIDLIVTWNNHTWAKVDFLAPKQNQTKVKDLNFEQNEPNNFPAIKMEINNNKKQPKNLLTKRYKSKIKQN